MNSAVQVLGMDASEMLGCRLENVKSVLTPELAGRASCLIGETGRELGRGWQEVTGRRNLLRSAIAVSR